MQNHCAFLIGRSLLSLILLFTLFGLLSCDASPLEKEPVSTNNSTVYYEPGENEFKESIRLARSLLSSGHPPQTLNYRIVGSVDSSDFIESNFALGSAIPSYELEGEAWIRADWDLYPVLHHGELCGVLIRYLGDMDNRYGLDYDLAVPALMPELQEALAEGASLAFARDGEGEWIVTPDGKWYDVQLDDEAVDALYPIEYRIVDNPSQPIERNITLAGLSFASQDEPVSFVLEAVD